MKKEFDEIAIKNKKKTFEMIVDFLCYDEEWNPENELLTAAMKLKGENIIKRYKNDIDGLYKNIKK